MEKTESMSINQLTVPGGIELHKDASSEEGTII
jgi:hypothetical protein